MCTFANATPACANQICILGPCKAGYGDCDGLAANGCETSVIGDAKNCGKCGNVCPNNMSTCSAGVCTAIGCNAAALKQGCASVNGACWCKTTANLTTGAAVCGYPANYAGVYYSINGRNSNNLNANMDGNAARAILSALGESPDSSYCNATAGAGTCSQQCSCDCATNILSTGSWGTSMTCYTDAQRWARGTNIVRCTGFEM